MTSRRTAPLGLLRILSLAAVVAAAAAAPAACSSSNASAPTGAPDGAAPDATTPTGDAGPGTPVARFVLGAGTTPPNFLDVPFPTDAYLSNGAVLGTIPGLEALVPGNTSFIDYGLGLLNGFSRVGLSIFTVDVPGGDAGVYAYASAHIDPTTLPVAETDCTTNTSSVYLLDLSPAAGASPLLPCRAGFHDDQPKTKHTPAVIVVGPPRGYVLAEAHQYAVVLTSRVKDTAGHALSASSDFASVVSGAAPGPIGKLYATAYATASAELKTALAGASIVSMSVFTTMQKSGELFAMREALETAAAPTLSWDPATMAPMGAAKFAALTTPPASDAGAEDAGSDAASSADAGAPALPAGFTASLDDWLGVVPASGKLPDGGDDPDIQQPIRAHDKIASVGTAVFSAASYLQTNATGYSDPKYATFAYDSSGNPTPQANVKIWITFLVPKTPMPPGGYPVVVVQHGLGGSREFLLTVANVLAGQGWIVAGIDSVTFGARAPEPANQVDSVNDFSGTYAGPDGFADTENGSNDFFGNLLNIVSIRDQFREAGFDVAQVVKVLRSSPNLAPLDTGSGAPRIDPNHVLYLGDSLGSMQATIGAAIEPHVQAWYLDVNAGSLFPDLVAHSPTIGPLLSTAANINFQISGDIYNWTHPLVQVLQNIVEPGDPVIYAQYLTTSPHTLGGVATKPRNALMSEVLWDSLVSDEGSEALARAAGWGLAVPNVGSNADVTSVAEAANNPRATPFVMINPDDAGAIHDTPVAGSTAVVFQIGPAQHGADLVDSVGEYLFDVPYIPPFVQLQTPVTFPEDYATVQKVCVQFLADAVAGTVPRLRGFDTPVRTDIDGGP